MSVTISKAPVKGGEVMLMFICSLVETVLPGVITGLILHALLGNQEDNSGL